MLRKYLVGIGALVVLVVVICLAAPVRPDQLDRGGEWLSWSPGERATFVNGFIAGYRQGSHSACEVAQELFGEPGKMYRLGDEKQAAADQDEIAPGTHGGIFEGEVHRSFRSGRKPIHGCDHRVLHKASRIPGHPFRESHEIAERP